MLRSLAIDGAWFLIRLRVSTVYFVNFGQVFHNDAVVQKLKKVWRLNLPVSPSQRTPHTCRRKWRSVGISIFFDSRCTGLRWFEIRKSLNTDAIIVAVITLWKCMISLVARTQAWRSVHSFAFAGTLARWDWPVEGRWKWGEGGTDTHYYFHNVNTLITNS